MLWDTGKDKMQVCWTQQNEYAFTVHTGGVWCLLEEEELVQQVKGRGSEKEDAGESTAMIS